MKTAVIALTKNGVALAAKICAGFDADGYCPASLLVDGMNEGERTGMLPLDGDFHEFVGRIFGSYRALVFIMACGIVVRNIAPYLKDKTVDPAVIVMDEKGAFVISLLSGHFGGANELAREIAHFTQGQAVITTATDVNGMIALDVFAKNNDCEIENRPALKQISSALVNGDCVSLFTDCRLEGQLPPYILPGGEEKTGKNAVVLSNSILIEPQYETVLYLRPRNLIIGIGCRKGITEAAIAEALADFLVRCGKSPLSVKRVVSIDLKANEAGIVNYCREKNLPYRTVSVEDVKKVENHFTCSPFVKKTVGVGVVAEACAVLGGENARLVTGKTIYQGLTLALAEEEKVYRL